MTKLSEGLLATTLSCLMCATTQSVAIAQTQPNTTARLDPVIVTATKREQHLSDVSSAISVASAQLLRDQNINTLEDLQVAIPGLTVGNDFAFAKLYLRGMGLNSALPGLDPSVAVHVDGAVISQASQQFSALYDLERVEVLRGPQGTLYGRNATGGSVNLITAKPSDTLEAYTRLTLGGPDANLVADAAISGSLTNAIQGRLALRYQDRQGYGTHTKTGYDIDDANTFGIRGQVNFDISENITNLVMAEIHHENSAAKALKFFAPSFSGDAITALQADTNLDPALAAQIPNLVTLAGTDALAGSRNIGGDVLPVGDLETLTLSNTFEWQLNESLQFRSLTNYREGESTLLQDFDVSNLINGQATLGDTLNGGLLSATEQATATPSTVQAQIVENSQTSQEFQLTYDGASWNGILGAYYFKEDVAATVLIGANPLPINSRVNVRTLANSSLGTLLPDTRVIIPGDMDIEAIALFANVNFDLSDALRLKLGGRYSEEDRDIVVSTRLPGPQITLGPNADSRSYSSFTPEIGLEYDWQDMLVYLTYSEGFKSGTSSLFDGTPELINPETITNYEVGAKGLYFDNTLELALAGFIYRIEDAQFDRTRLTATGARFSTSVENAASTDGHGIELEGSWQATPALRFDFNSAWYDISFDDFTTTNPTDPLGALQGLAGVTVDTVNLSGNRPRNTPEYALGLRTTYTQDLQNGGVINYGLAYAYKGDQYFTEFNDDIMRADAYGILDANLRYELPNSNVSVNLWGKNLSDEFVASGAFAISTSRTITGTYLPPRSFGVTINWVY